MFQDTGRFRLSSELVPWVVISRGSSESMIRFVPTYHILKNFVQETESESESESENRICREMQQCGCS